MWRVCVVGSGPGGMYAAKYLLRSSIGAAMRVDVVDRLPTCYGLVRYGVAPDHPEVKSVSNDFDEVMNDERVRFYGNVEVGNAVGVDKLLSVYDSVILAYGANNDRHLGLDRESEATNLWGAREFVNWYNGHPDMADRTPPLLDCEGAAIVGQGNVALDCARILTKDVDELAKTDISRTALEMLSQSKIRHVSVLGRRGAAQAAFTIKEMRELTKLKGVGCLVHPDEMELSHNAASLEEIEATRARKRINELLVKTAGGFQAAQDKPRKVDVRFLVSPTELHLDSAGRVSGLTLQRNTLSGAAFSQSAVPAPAASPEHLDCGLVIRSIGYQSEPLPGVPFDRSRNTIKHDTGRVDGMPGLYTSGWVKRGPTGIIGTNIGDARETVDAIVADLSGAASPKGRTEEFPALLAENHDPIVDWDAYSRLAKFEEERGQAGSPQCAREKVLTKQKMLQVAQVQ